MKQSVFNCYHYRGDLKATFLTDEEARVYCNSQKIPTEFYWEVDARDIDTQETKESQNG